MFPLIAFTLGQLTCPTAPGVVEWRTRADEPARVYLYVDGRQRGGYDAARDEWRDFDPATGGWAEPRPLTARPAVGETNFGVMRDRLAAGTERFTLNGASATPSQAREALAGLVDDSQWLRLTVIGDEAERRAVLDDLDKHPELAPLRERLLVQAYAPDHWAVATTGFATMGKPTIYLQAPDGRVLHRQDDYGGPERLAGAIRRADPNYRPERDPNLDRLPFWLRLSRLPGWVWAVAAILFLFLISKRRNSP